MSGTNGEQSTRQPESKRAITRDQYDAVLLDLDGVITDTASIHAACWKQMFDTLREGESLVIRHETEEIQLTQENSVIVRPVSRW
jgi:phosphoglycolate phosphatase-like HAD superfamily hydrolase